jgi:hypothetical protein
MKTIIEFTAALFLLVGSTAWGEDHPNVLLIMPDGKTHGAYFVTVERLTAEATGE